MPARLRSTLLVSAVGAIALTAAAPAQAGLFDFLFGGGGNEAPQPRYRVEGPPLNVRVNPRRLKATKPGQVIVRGKGKGSQERKVVAKRSIDPVKNPNWYLEDPTLRRGDIVVLKGEILVYEGGRGAASRSEFTSLKQSTLVSKGERDRIAKMATNPADPVTTEAATPKGKEASLRPAE